MGAPFLRGLDRPGEVVGVLSVNRCQARGSLPGPTGLVAILLLSPTVVAIVSGALRIGVVTLRICPALLLLALGLAQKSAVVLGELQVALCGNAVACNLCIASERLILIDDLLGRTPNLAVRACTLEDAVDDVAHPLTLMVVTSGFVPGP